MADDRWLVRELTDVIATATESGCRRATSEPIPHAEQVQLQRRKVMLLRAIAERSPHSREVGDLLGHAERRLQQITGPHPSPHVEHAPDLEAAP